MSLFQRSAAAGVLIVCTLIIRGLASYKLPKRTFTALWKLAVLRLLLPFSFQVRYSLVREWASPVLYLKEAGVGTMDGKAYGLIGLFLRNIGLAWFLGVIISAFFFMSGYVKAYWQLREAIPFENGRNDITVKDNLYGLTKGVKIKVLDRIAAPLTYGIFCPCIILPKSMDFSDRDMLVYVLRHELMHVLYRDNLWKFLSIMALCLHWFNPLAFVMLFFLNKDMEIACDESVVSAMGEKDRKKYAMALVTLAETQYPLFSGFGESAVSERIKKIMKYKKVTKIGSLCAALILLGATAVFVSAKEEERYSAAPMSGTEVADENVGDTCGYETSAAVFFEEGISEERIEEIGNEILAIEGVDGIAGRCVGNVCR